MQRLSVMVTTSPRQDFENLFGNVDESILWGFIVLILTVVVGYPNVKVVFVVDRDIPEKSLLVHAVALAVPNKREANVTRVGHQEIDLGYVSWVSKRPDESERCWFGRHT